jgi:hypothetical protein
LIASKANNMKATIYFGLLAAVLVIHIVSLLGAAVLDSIQYDTLTADTKAEIDRKFKEQSLKLGAWVMDRECVSEHIGMDVTTLPSYKRTDDKTLELASGIECSQ